MNEKENQNVNQTPNQQNNTQAISEAPAFQAAPPTVPPVAPPNQDAIVATDTNQQEYQATPATTPETTAEAKKTTFGGRIGRLGYFLGHVYIAFTLAAFLILMFVIAPALSLLDDGPLRIILSIPLFLIGATVIALILLAQISLIIRRLHDLGRPWFWILLTLLPVVDFIFALYLIFVPGQEGSNQWGEPMSSRNYLKVLGFK